VGDGPVPGGDDLERLNALVQAALDRPPQERARWVNASCGSDDVLRQRLLERLRATEGETEHWYPGDRLDPSSGIRIDPASPIDRDVAPLTPGQQLGRYEILDLLGAGGMGRVYRALDPSLGREVAIKALANAFRGDSGSLRRFEREARVLAALSHPNIAAIYGFERLDGSPYLVLERVDGETLAQRLARGPLSLRDAVAVAIQVIEGLEEAHGKGVVHRDLKPSNVMLTSGDRAKLVDFGLAKTASPESDTEVSANPITQAGAVLGTARYMSPEQVRGEDVDTRTDVWAFGCLLYEMLTGRAAFGGRSVAEVLAAVLRDEPDWQALPSGTPPSVRRLLHRCLRRDQRARLQHIGDARLDLLDAESEAETPAAPVRPASPRITRAQLWTVAIVGLAALGAVLLVMPWSVDVAPQRPARLSLELPVQIAASNDFAAPFAIAPGGGSFVVEGAEGGRRQLYLRALGDLGFRKLAGSDGARQPFFSPDGDWVAFFADRKLLKAPVAGGAPLTIADVGGNPRGAVWVADGNVIVAASQTAGLVRIPDRGGPAVALTTLDRAHGEYSHRWPDVLPGGTWVLFTVGFEDASFDEARIEAVAVASGERRVVLQGAGFARYLPPRQLLFVRGGRLHKVAFDPEELAIRGAPEVVLDAVRYDPRNGGTHVAVSASGMLVYTPGVPTSSEYFLDWVERDGRVQRAVDTARPFRDPRLSPDGRRVAVTVGTSTASDLWLVDANGTFSRLSFGLSPHRSTWTPDGARITVGAQKDGRWRLLSIAADGSGEPVALFESANRVYPNTWSPDGRRLVFQESAPGTGWDLKMLDVDASGRVTGSPTTLAATPAHETGASISPDGHWMAYESDELDAIVQIYVRSFPEGGHKLRASNEGARLPAWGENGEVYFWSTTDGKLKIARTRRDGAQLAVSGIELMYGANGAPSPAVLSRIVVTSGGARFDVPRSGARVLVLESATPPDAAPPFTRPVVVFDWADRPVVRRRLLF
jgi:Tol biopolymer transport system component